MTIDTPSLPASERLPQIFEAFAAQGAPCATDTTTYGFRLKGNGGGDFILSMSPDAVEWTPVAEGEELSAPVTVTISVDDLVQIVDGSIDGRFAISSERMEIEGDLDAAAAMLGLVQDAIVRDSDAEEEQVAVTTETADEATAEDAPSAEPAQEPATDE